MSILRLLVLLVHYHTRANGPDRDSVREANAVIEDLKGMK